MDEAVTKKDVGVWAEGPDQAPKTGAAHLCPLAGQTQHRTLGMLRWRLPHLAADAQPLADVAGFTKRDLWGDRERGEKGGRLIAELCWPHIGLWGGEQGGTGGPKAARRCSSFRPPST